MGSITRAGIDVSKDCLDVYLEGGGGGRRLKVANTPLGIAQLLEQLPTGAIVALEASGRYEAKVRHELQRKGFDVRVQNPRLVRRLAQGMGIQAKTDLIDAQVLARTAELCAPNSPRSQERERLGDLERTIVKLKRERAGHRRRLSSPGFEGTAAQSLERIVQMLGREILALEKAFVSQVKESSLSERYKLALSVTGVGPALARSAICELPEYLHEWSSRQISAYSGVAPIDDSSGKRQGTPRLSRHANMHLKAALYMPAMALVSRDTWAKALYRRLRQKGLAHQQAIVAVMRKLLLQLTAVLKRGTPWRKEANQP